VPLLVVVALDVLEVLEVLDVPEVLEVVEDVDAVAEVVVAVAEVVVAVAEVVVAVTEVVVASPLMKCKSFKRLPVQPPKRYIPLAASVHTAVWASRPDGAVPLKVTSDQCDAWRLKKCRAFS